MHVASFYPNYFNNTAIGYCILSILEAMESDAIEGSIMATASDKGFENPFYTRAIPASLNAVAYRLFNQEQLIRFSEFRFLQYLRGGEHIYLWGQSGISAEFCKKLHDRGHRMTMETINTLRVTSKAILDKEYARLGLPSTHGITTKSVDLEMAVLELVDYNFSCSHEVKKSLIKGGIAESKILDTTYGLRESDILPSIDLEKRAEHKGLTAIFVGSIGIRKAPHLLLDYWCRSKIKGKLQLVGNIEPDAIHLITPYLKRDDIEHVPYVTDLRDLYRNADLFLLPSLEEGSPLVTYLALGAGLPSIVSPMGGGGLIEHGVNGLILDPFDDEGWINALQQMAENADLRVKFSINTYEKAPKYLWSEVGRRRAQSLLSVES